jgi:hypothetical protein
MPARRIYCMSSPNDSRALSGPSDGPVALALCVPFSGLIRCYCSPAVQHSAPPDSRVRARRGPQAFKQHDVTWAAQVAAGPTYLDKAIAAAKAKGFPAYCRCSDNQFALFAWHGLIPIPARSEVWTRPEIDWAVRRLDVRKPDSLAEVYFIRCSRYVKIGYSADGGAHGRMANMQTASPFELELLGVIPGDTETEGLLHQLFRIIHVRGEWFHKSPVLLAYMDWIGATKASAV